MQNNTYHNNIRDMNHGSFLFFFKYIHTMHLDVIKVIYSPTNAQVIVLKTILKFTFGAVLM